MKGRASKRRAGILTLAFAAVLTAALLPGTAAAETRYSLQGDCYTLTSTASGQGVPGAAAQRMQATRLGSYMLYGTARDFLAAAPGNTVARTAQPGPAADWQVEEAGDGSFTLSPASARGSFLSFSGGTLTLVPRAGATAATHFNFVPASGCAVFPEAPLDVSGNPAKGAAPYGEVRGFMDGHMHWMTYEYLGGNFHCGAPWSPYGIPAALPDCSSIEGPLGAAAPFQNFLNYGNPVMPHDTAGYPTLPTTGAHNLTVEGTYYRWIERDWMAGLRLMVMPINENRILCTLEPNRKTNCDEMDTVYRGIDDINALQDYVDAQAGGPGKGFFRLVTDPFQARRVINQGKMAVILEVEVSEPFGCTNYLHPTCNKAQVDAGLDKLYEHGVRSSLLLNKFDNPLTGVRFDSGPIGALINGGNLASGGAFWDATHCDGPHDNNIDAPAGVPGDAGFINQQLLKLGVTNLPVYPSAPNCNTRGLTDLGAHVVERMMDKGMIVNPDHMSQAAVDKTITLAEQRNYSGVISPHGWMDPRNWPRIFKLGGMAFPDSNSTSTFVNDWHQYRPRTTPHYFGWGYGADLGGLANQPDPVAPGSPDAVTYPFKSLDGAVTVDRQQTGSRTFDYPTEGVAQYGLYADWLEEVRKVGGPQLAEDMLRGSEAYLQMWERAEGIKQGGCIGAKTAFDKGGLGALRLGLDDGALLRKAGQPLQRTRAWSYCVGRAPASAATAVLTPEGKVTLVASSGPGAKALGIGPGMRLKHLKRLKGRVKRLGKDLWVARVGRAKGKGRAAKKHRKPKGNQVAFQLAGKRIIRVALVGPDARGVKHLPAYLRLIPNGGFSARPRTVQEDRPQIPVTSRNAVSLKVQDADGKPLSMVCGLTPPQPAGLAENPFAAPEPNPSTAAAPARPNARVASVLGSL